CFVSVHLVCFVFFLISPSCFFFFFFFSYSPVPRVLHSFPTRRSSDLTSPASDAAGCSRSSSPRSRSARRSDTSSVGWSCRRPLQDRKSTRLNSSHGSISYAVFCLKKKKE